MEIRKVTACYFSPNGTTQKITETVARAFGKETRTADLLRTPQRDLLEFASDELLVVGMPVYAGRIPPLCVDQMRRITGGGAPALALAVYGNRAFEDALLEMKDLLEAGGFFVPAAGAFLAQHSIFGKVAAGRPDDGDMEKIQAFARRSAAILERLPADAKPSAAVPGSRPYREPSSVPLKPSADKTCTACGVCARLCPTGSIPEKDPSQTEKDTCISCGACIHNCPAGARAFRGVAWQAAGAVFQQKFGKRKEPETFFCEG